MYIINITHTLGLIHLSGDGVARDIHLSNVIFVLIKKTSKIHDFMYFRKYNSLYSCLIAFKNAENLRIREVLAPNVMYCFAGMYVIERI